MGDMEYEVTFGCYKYIQNLQFTNTTKYGIIFLLRYTSTVYCNREITFMLK